MSSSRRRDATLHPEADRPWNGDASRARIAEIAASLPTGTEGLRERIEALVAAADATHDVGSLQLNPATNTMNPRAAALLSSGIGTRPSLGHPGSKYEMGLEEVEEIEVVCASLAAGLFRADFAEVRLPSGSIANLAGFLALGRPGDAMIVPPASIGGHVTHHLAGAAGLAGFEIHEAPVDPDRYVVDVDGLAELAERVGPSIITMGASLNLDHHPVSDVRAIADDVGAKVLFDAAHLSGLIAGGAWPDPLAEGAHLLTMSTYKSLAGPAAGLAVTDDAGVAEALDAVVHPGLTANFDVAKTAALAVTLVDWLDHGAAFAEAMVDAARSMAEALVTAGVALFATPTGATRSHAFALDARHAGGGHALAGHLRRAGLLTSAIGLPVGDEPSDAGLRMSPAELVRWGATPDSLGPVADLVARAVAAPSESVAELADETRALRAGFDRLSFCA